MMSGFLSYKKYVGIVLLVAGIICFFVSKHMQQKQLSYKEKLMQQLLSEKMAMPQDFFAIYKGELNKLIQKPETIEVMKSLNEQKQELSIDNYAVLLKQFFAQLECNDVLMVTMDSALAFVLNEKSMVGHNLLQYPYKDQELAQVANLSLSTLSQQLSSFIMDPESKIVSIYLAQPVFSGDRIVGTVVLHINSQSLLRKMTDYAKLGTTGEVLLGQISEIIKMYLVPPRHIEAAALAKNVPHDKQLFEATSGGTGLAVTKDYRQHEVIAAWDYSAETNLGMVVKQDLGEIFFNAKLLMNIFFALIFFACVIFLFSLLHQHTRHEYVGTIRNVGQWLQAYASSFVKLFTFGLLGLSIFCFFFALYNYHQQKYTAQNIAKAGKVIYLRSITQQINSSFYQMEAVAQEIEKSLPGGMSDIEAFIKEKLTKNNVISGICIAFASHAYKQEVELYAPFVFRVDDKIQLSQVDKLYNYMYGTGNQKFDTQWYVTTMNTQKPLWHLTQLDGITAHESLVYCKPFYADQDNEKKNALGVLVITYFLSKFEKMIENFELATACNCVAISPKGQFLYHADKKYVIEHQTITDVVKTDALDKPAADMQQYYETLMTKHFHEINREPLWTFFETIPLTGWTVGVSFPYKEALRKTDLLSPHLKTAFALVFMLALFSLIIMKLWFGSRWLFAVAVYSLIFIGGNSYLWNIIDQRPFIYPANEEIIDDAITLKNIIDEQQQKSGEQGEAYVPIKTGISLSALSVTSGRDSTFTGFVWQKYSDEQAQEKVLPVIGFAEMQKLSMQETARHKKGNELYVGWDVTGANQQSYSVIRYPFIKQQVKINMVQKEQFKHLMPVPDFDGFAITKDNRTPWLEKKFPGLETSYFSYKKLSERKKVVNQLTLNVVVKSDITQAIMGYLLPIIVVLIAAFATFWIPAGFRLGTYSGLGFAAVLVQKNVRDKVPSEQMVFLEWFVIFAYITLFILTVLAIIAILNERRAKKLEAQQPVTLERPVALERQSSDALSLELLYWPIQFTMWFVTTAWFFM